MSAADDVVIVGIGQSDIGRGLNRSPLSLTVDATLEALEDAGLTREEIDGVTTWPGASDNTPGFSGVGVPDIQDALGLNLNWYAGGAESAGQFGAIFNAYAGIKAGLATTVLSFRTVWEATARNMMRNGKIMGSGGGRISGDYEWIVPYGAVSASCWAALTAQRRFHEFGTTREQLGQVAVNARKNAQLNPKGLYKDPLTIDDYMNARMISDPLCLYDCDAHSDGSTAVIMTTAERAKDLKGKAVRIESLGSGLYDRPSWIQFSDLTTMSARDAGKMMWSRTSLKPSDVELAELYDGFSIITLVWLEALGLCGKGEAGSFVEGGQRISLTGEMPLNTHGGQLSAGRTHGYGFLHEACVQLRGDGGARQVPGDPRVGVASAGGGPICGSLLLVRD